MAFKLNEVVPWGRSYEEYLSMFNLSETDLALQILGCGDGPASFNMEMWAQGRKITSIDPIYQFTVEEIRSRIDATCVKIVDQLSRNLDDFVWQQIKSPEQLADIRMRAMQKFLSDFENGKRQGRYVACGLPHLPFEAISFDLALSSHLLFLYPDKLSLKFHIESIEHMMHIAKEVRIFPILTLGGRTYPFLEAIFDRIIQSGYNYAVEQVDYEFQRGGNQMLRIFRPS